MAHRGKGGDAEKEDGVLREWVCGCVGVCGGVIEKKKERAKEKRALHFFMSTAGFSSLAAFLFRAFALAFSSALSVVYEFGGT